MRHVVIYFLPVGRLASGKGEEQCAARHTLLETQQPALGVRGGGARLTKTRCRCRRHCQQCRWGLMQVWVGRASAVLEVVVVGCGCFECTYPLL